MAYRWGRCIPGTPITPDGTNHTGVGPWEHTAYGSVRWQLAQVSGEHEQVGAGDAALGSITAQEREQEERAGNRTEQ